MQVVRIWYVRLYLGGDCLRELRCGNVQCGCWSVDMRLLSGRICQQLWCQRLHSVRERKFQSHRLRDVHGLRRWNVRVVYRVICLRRLQRWHDPRDRQELLLELRFWLHRSFRSCGMHNMRRRNLLFCRQVSVRLLRAGHVLWRRRDGLH